MEDARSLFEEMPSNKDLLVVLSTSVEITSGVAAFNSLNLQFQSFTERERARNMMYDIIRNPVAFCGSVRSISWRALSLPLRGVVHCYYALIHVFAILWAIAETLRLGGSDLVGKCPPYVSMNDKAASDSENKKFLHNIQSWSLAPLFHALDRNRDGVVSAGDIQGMMEKFGLQFFCDESMKIVMDIPEHMSFTDFRRLCVNLLGVTECAESTDEASEKAELREAFSVFDKDGDGFITPWELQQVLLSLGLKEGQHLENCEIMIYRFDKDHDGRIDIMEFEDMFTMTNRPY